mgnify:FL=1
MEQRTYEWKEARRGMFTASGIYKLMGAKGLGQTGESYVMEKVTEALGVDLNEVTTYAMQYGIDMEPQAKAYYEQSFNCSITDVGFIISTWCNESGASPDGIINGEKLIEIKCPFNPVHHTQNLLIKSAYDLKKLRPEYYWQVQHQMAVTGINKCDFVSFCPAFISEINGKFSGINRMIAITIEANQADIELLKIRIFEAVELKHKILKQINL